MATSGSRVRSGRPVSTSKSRKVIERLRQKMKDGSFYEAHQTYKALYQRFCAQGSEEEAIGLLLEGASSLLKHEQVGVGAKSWVLSCGNGVIVWWCCVFHMHIIRTETTHFSVVTQFHSTARQKC